MVAVLMLSVVMFAGCATSYTFEAEHAIIEDGSGAWNPVTESGIDVKDGASELCPGISNISDGSSLTWKLISNKATTATITLRAASHHRNWGIEPPTLTAVEDVSKVLTLTVNGKNVAVRGQLFGGEASVPEDIEANTAYLVSSITVTVDLVSGENVIKYTVIGSNNDGCCFFMDKIIVETDATLTFTQTDNSDRVWGM